MIPKNFLPRFWAKLKIDYLLKQIRLYGESQARVDEIIDLAIQYNIQTPYTHFAWGEPGDDDDDDTVWTHKEPPTPTTFKLLECYPNPFNPSLTIRLNLAEEGHYFIAIYNLLGEIVAILREDLMLPGEYRLIWPPRQLPSGIYFVTVRGPNTTLIQKVVYMK